MGGIGIIGKLFGGGGKILEDARGLIDEVVTSKEEKAILGIKFEEMLQTHEKELLELELKDTDSARSREIELVKTGSKNLTQNILAYIGVVGFFFIVGYLLARGLDAMSTEASFIIGNLTGMAGAIAKDIFGYYFGSSKGEQENQSWIKSKKA